MSSDRVIVVAKRSAYTQFVEEDRDPRVRALVQRSDPSVRHWKRAHQEHIRTLETVEEVLADLGMKPWVIRGPEFAFDSRDSALVITVGGDGTLLAASHHVNGTPVLGVNSAPRHSVGFFCGAKRSNVRVMIARALDNKLTRVELARMLVKMDGRIVSRRVLNEALFCHVIPAATSRYILRCQGQREEQRSSGVWVGTAAGSTGAIRSAGGSILPLKSRKLQLVVREPYQGEGRPYRWTKLVVPEDGKVSLQNKMHDSKLFLDGPFKQVNVRLASVLEFATSDETLHVLGVSGRGRR